MKRTAAFFATAAATAATATLAASLIVGCSHTSKNESTASATKYDAATGQYGTPKDEFDRGPEPQVNPDTHFAAGQLCESEGHADCAQVQYEQALRLNPRHIPSLYRMGVVLTKEKKYDDAVAIWKRYIDATGNLASGYSNLGFTYEMAADVDNAEKSYKQGIDIDPKDKPCRINYGLMLARQNRTDEAQEQLAIVLPPAEVSYNLATIYEQQGAIARAKEELEKALAANPDMPEAQNKLANLPQD
jgi:tetratricopeptide (TPR) repeat protein